MRCTPGGPLRGPPDARSGPVLRVAAYSAHRLASCVVEARGLAPEPHCEVEKRQVGRREPCPMVIGRGAADLMIPEPEVTQKLPMSGEAVDVRVGGGERKEDPSGCG